MEFPFYKKKKSQIFNTKQNLRVNQVIQFPSWNTSQHFPGTFKTPDGAALLKLTYFLQSQVTFQ